MATVRAQAAMPITNNVKVTDSVVSMTNLSEFSSGSPAKSFSLASTTNIDVPATSKLAVLSTLAVLLAVLLALLLLHFADFTDFTDFSDRVGLLVDLVFDATVGLLVDFDDKVGLLVDLLVTELGAELFTDLLV